jgi:hypothetical protein
MAYETGTATTQQDLLDKLQTFAAANGWTVDEWNTSGKELSMHRSTVYVHFQWDSTATTGGIGIYQSLGWIAAGTNPWQHTDDSGTGLASLTGPYTSQRRVDRIGDGPFTKYFFFEDDTYIHVVLEYAPGLYRHFGMGILEKVGTWTGGEYAYGHIWYNSFGVQDYPQDSRHSFSFDARNTNASTDNATLHVEGLPGEPSASTKWGVMWQGTSPGNDRAAVARVNLFGGLRDGPLTNALSWMPANPNNGYIPLVPIPIYYRRDAGSSPEKWYLLGFAKATRLINIRNYNPGDEITVGSDTWTVFPWVRKKWDQDDTDETGNMGIAYQKITA